MLSFRTMVSNGKLHSSQYGPAVIFDCNNNRTVVIQMVQIT